MEIGELENFLNTVANQFHKSANPGKLIVNPVTPEPQYLDIFNKQ